MTTTLEQKRAAHALEQIQSLDGTEYGHYVSYVSALPATILMNGLGHALLTLCAKAKNNRNRPHYLLYTHVASWLALQVTEFRRDVNEPGSPDEVIQKLMVNDQQVYVHAQAEALAYLNWLKQFARAYLREEEGQGDD